MLKWKKMQTMKTLGCFKDTLFYLRILTVCTVLSTALQISSRVGNTSVENTSSRNESLEVANASGRVRVTGKHTTEVLKNLQRTGNFWGMEISEEK